MNDRGAYVGYLVAVVVVDPLKLFKVLKKGKKTELYGQSVLAVIWVDRAAVRPEWEGGSKFTFLSGPVLHAGDPYTRAHHPFSETRTFPYLRQERGACTPLLQ